MSDHHHPLQAFRDSRGLTRAELADLLDVSAATIWRWEHGKRKVSGSKVADIAAATGIPARTLRPDLAELLQEPAQ